MKVTTCAFPGKMSKEAPFRTDMPTSSIKIEMDAMSRLILLSQMDPTQEISLLLVLICLSMLYSDLNMDMLRLILTHWFYGKHSSVILQMELKL